MMPDRKRREFCLECDRPLISGVSKERGLCGPCFRRARVILRYGPPVEDGFEAVEPWDGWDT